MLHRTFGELRRRAPSHHRGGDRSVVLIDPVSTHYANEERQRRPGRPDTRALDPFLAKWGLVSDGDYICTAASTLLPVRAGCVAAMLKVSSDSQERVGSTLMEWWSGEGAARVLAREGGALLMERATGTGSLNAMSRSGDDEGACRILCAAAERLRALRPTPPPETTPLEARFHDLLSIGDRLGPDVSRGASAARTLLSTPRDVGILHGDLHHGNVLDFGARAWLAIDPKGLQGERGFDYANIFCNPDLSDPVPSIAAVPDVFLARLALVAELADLDRGRLLLWILAWSCLSAVWIADAGQTPDVSLAVARLAVTELDR